MTGTKAVMLLVSVAALSGCACVSQEYVDKQDAMLGDRIGKIESRLTADEAKLNELGNLGGKVDTLASDLSAVKSDAAEAKTMAADASRKADDSMRCCQETGAKAKKAFELQQRK